MKVYYRFEGFEMCEEFGVKNSSVIESKRAASKNPLHSIRSVINK
jgi:hypothetical protein